MTIKDMDNHPLMVFAQECVLGVYRKSEVADAAQLAINHARQIKDDPMQNQLMALIDENQRLRAELKFNTPPQRAWVGLSDRMKLVFVKHAPDWSVLQLIEEIEQSLKENNT